MTGTASPRRGGFIRSGGWLVFPLAVITTFVAWWQISLVVDSRTAPRRGDGRNVETYGYDLSTLTVDRAALAASGLPRNGIQPLDYPPLISPGGVGDVKPITGRAKYLVSTDRVIGVTVGDHARAYPLRVLAWHEVLNDTLGGWPIAVTYSPKCDAAVVFDRRLDGDVVELGFSGLVYNANLVLYDRRESEADESLWGQILARAIAGPAAARDAELTVHPFDVDHWGSWVSRHPGTTVIDPDRVMMLKYRTEPYGNYYGNDLLPDAPLSAAPGDDAFAKKAPIVVLCAGETCSVVPFRWIRERVDGPSGRVTVGVGAADVTLSFTDDPPVTRVVPARRDPVDAGADRVRSAVVAIPMLRFAWHALHPDMRFAMPQVAADEPVGLIGDDAIPAPAGERS